MTAIALLIK